VTTLDAVFSELLGAADLLSSTRLQSEGVLSKV
jgi:hypothetical protein